MTRKIDEKGLVQRQQAARKHGIYAFQNRGTDALSAENVKSLQELRQLMRTAPGREDVRRELASRVAMICWMGFAELQKAGQQGNLWSTPVIRRAATWVAELRRLLDSFSDESDIIDAEVVLKAVRNDGREDKEID